jgi:hypothetical protein
MELDYEDILPGPQSSFNDVTDMLIGIYHILSCFPHLALSSSMKESGYNAGYAADNRCIAENLRQRSRIAIALIIAVQSDSRGIESCDAERLC